MTRADPDPSAVIAAALATFAQLTAARASGQIPVCVFERFSSLLDAQRYSIRRPTSR
ncbi:MULTISPECIES: hypothetical protein [Paraburkholderia]|jgi:hypothetical protein|uniref:hypothetical protein n=1 Tax=Paraburkholderia TaxID=1822464 RepID=UPI00225228F6|nr:MULTISPECIES: hypothetical protein [Paraburkholderia]MCX4164186.1 hypothetical protein [Paraburkholderia megapolitana]MDN7159680.1 hypothetical protein [Paraburkholderia sp. CHISQ3]MDQ6496727.1 hypothetical protein [Paraburkholderia megapolitana]